MAPSVYLLFHRDASGTPTILSVYAELPDANAACVQQAEEAKYDIKGRSPRELQRWEAPDGTSCWVEKHTVVTRKPTPAARVAYTRKDSSLYDNDEDDIIEVQDKDDHYD